MRRGLTLGSLLILVGSLGAQTQPDPTAVDAMARNAVEDFFADETLRDYTVLAVLAEEGEVSLPLAEAFNREMLSRGVRIIGPAVMEQALVDLDLPPRQLPISQDLTDLFNRFEMEAVVLVRGVRTPDPGWHGTFHLYDPSAGGYPWIVDVSVEIDPARQGARRSLLQEHPEYAIGAVIAVFVIGAIVRKMRR